MVEAILLDLDGTFADTAPDLGEALNHVRSLHSLPPLPLATIRPQASHGSPGLLKLGMNVSPDSDGYDEMRAAFLEHYEAHICDRTKLFPGMAALISEFEERDLPWGIVTNKPHRYTVPLMEKLGYATRAACLVSGDTCEEAKPHPAPLLHAANLIGVQPERCLYLGDDLRDMQAANAARMIGIIAVYGYIDPVADTTSWPSAGSVNSPFELLKYLGAL
ncbi:MAG: HAD-IA family hydrolase [Gammaproteobacteria bacterium]|nr:HAD-IA family hydrolase [Gammaproteobacteria bacterium]MBU1447261.1 HAD-IA family hydrolase [Gammaproteobacteria bacterium]MDD2928619.1 HAD-IA family hydrolase [Sideroxydans sp.]MDD5470831.1 HAD-IA family hydrolase [Sideroxydans sp.]